VSSPQWDQEVQLRRHGIQQTEPPVLLCTTEGRREADPAKLPLPLDPIVTQSLVFRIPL